MSARRRGHEFSDEVLDVLVTRLRVIAEPNRIRIMQMLNVGEASVQGLTAQLPTTHQNVSIHLGKLYQAGLVSRRREGSRMLYALADWTALWLLEQLAQGAAEQLEAQRELFEGQKTPGEIS